MADQISESLQRVRENYRFRWWIAASVALAGCAAAPGNPDALIVAPEPGRAVVVGWGNTAGEKARAALTSAPGTRVTSLVVSKANTNKSGFGENIARLSPGEYDLTISCELYLGYRNFSDDTVVHAALRAARVYRLRAAPEGRRCQPFLEDITGKDGQSG